MKWVLWEVVVDELIAQTFQALPDEELPDHDFPKDIIR